MTSDRPTSFTDLATELRQKIYRHALPARILQVGYDFPFPFLPKPGELVPITRPATLPNLLYVCRDSRNFCLSVYIPFAYTYVHPALDTLYFTRQASNEFLASLRQTDFYARPPLYPMALLDRVAVEFDKLDAQSGELNGNGTLLRWMGTFGYPQEILLVRGTQEYSRIGWEGLSISDEDQFSESQIVSKEQEPRTATELLRIEKEVLYIRHKIQKALLSRVKDPVEEEMGEMDRFLGLLETYTDLDISIIQTTKINKVLKAVLKLPTVPKDEELQFTSRSRALLERWTKSLARQGDKDLLKVMGSKLRLSQADDEWLWYRRPTLKCVNAIKDGQAKPKPIANLKAAEKVAREWLEAEKYGNGVAYDMAGTTIALETVGINTRFIPRF